MLSAPVMRPLAIDGAAPRTTTNRIARSDSWKIRIASGNQAIDGIVWRPVMSDPNGPQGRDPATRLPTTVPITIASAKPINARRMVMPRAVARVPSAA